MANKRLYVGGLPYEVNDDRLREVFLAHGNVESASVITDRYSGESRGFGFVEMGTEEEAAAAVAGLNDTEMDGRRITVAEARERQDRGRDRW